MNLLWNNEKTIIKGVLLHSLFCGSIINVGVPRDRNFGTPTFFANKKSME